MSKERAVLYARVSGDDHDEASKLDGQLAMCREYAEEHGYTILHEFQEDKYSSGADLDLPCLNQILDLARDGTFDILVCRELDRLARGIAKQLFIEDELKTAGVRIEYALENYDASPEGGLMKHVRASVAEYERLKIRQRTKRGKQNKARAGHVFTNGMPPYGYRETVVDGKKSLEVVPEEAEIVRDVFDLYLNGDDLGVNAIAKHLTDKGVSKAGEARHLVMARRISGHSTWHHSRVSNMLRRSVYRGKWLFGKHEDDPIEVSVPAIVSNDVWEAVQVKLNTKRMHRPLSRDYTFLLQDLAYCSECGGLMCCKTHRRLKSANRTRSYFYYKCRQSHEDPVYQAKCGRSSSYRADIIDADLWKHVKALVLDPDALSMAFREYKSSLQSDANPVRDKLAKKHRKLEKAERKLDRLLQ